MRAFVVTDIETRTTKIVDLNTAARLARLEADELDYMLGEEGICETDRYTIVDIVSDQLPPSIRPA